MKKKNFDINGYADALFQKCWEKTETASTPENMRWFIKKTKTMLRSRIKNKNMNFVILKGKYQIPYFFGTLEIACIAMGDL